MMKRLTLMMMMAAATVFATAQTLCEDRVPPYDQTVAQEFAANKFLSASNYLEYDRQMTKQALTPAPAGYKPFYLSHYGRHGSRWLIAKDSYTSVIEPMRKAQKYGKLTAKGEEVLAQLEAFFPTTIDRLGDLTTVGERQHHGIGKRMTQNFPEIFKSKDVTIDARSTVVVRCILSMVAECEELMAANPTARIHNDVSESLQYYLNQPRTGLVKAMAGKGREIRKQHNNRQQADRLMHLLFNDQQFVKDSLRAGSIMYNMFEIATNMQSHDTDIDLYPLFTPEEIIEMWRTRNIGWYIDYGPAPQTGGVMPFSQRNLLRNIIETADTVSQTQATLRFGHEVCVMPLACLLELDSCGVAVNNLDELEHHWRNYRIYPMGSNIQLIFYRPDNAANAECPMANRQDILVKALLNEQECLLPIPTTQYPYYRWSELRQYYLDKLERFDQMEREYLEKEKN